MRSLRTHWPTGCLALALIILFLQGCTLIDPHVRWDPVTDETIQSTIPVIRLTIDLPMQELVKRVPPTSELFPSSEDLQARQVLRALQDNVVSLESIQQKLNLAVATVRNDKQNRSTIVTIPLLSPVNESAVSQTIFNDWVVAAFPGSPRVAAQAQLAVTAGPASTMQAGIIYADRAIAAYQKGISQQSILTNVMALTLIPLAAAGLAMGIEGANAVSIAALGLSGAAIYGTGSFLSSKPRQLVYAAGVKAIVCAKEATLPLNLSGADFVDFKTSTEKLIDDSSKLEEMIRETRQAVTNVNNMGGMIAGAEESIKNAQESLDKAAEVVSAAEKLKREIGHANQALIFAVDKIAAEIDAAILTTLPNVQAISGIIGGLAQISGQFTSAPEVGKPKAEPSLSFEGMAAGDTGAKSEQGEVALEKLKKLQDATRSLQRLTVKVNGFILSVAETQPSQALKQCAVDPVPTGIFVRPTGPVRLRENVIKSIVVRGGKPPYFAESDTLQVKRSSPMGNIFIIGAKGVKPGEYILQVFDSAEHDEPVSVIVEEKEQGSPPPAPPPPSPPHKTTEIEVEKRKKIVDKLQNQTAPNVPYGKINFDGATVRSIDGHTLIILILKKGEALTGLEESAVVYENWVTLAFENAESEAAPSADGIEITIKADPNTLAK